MSIDSAKIVCTGCDYKTIEVFRPIRVQYQISNGRTVETGHAKGWCFDCASYSDIEKINQKNLRNALVIKEHERIEARHHQEKMSHGFLSRFKHRSEKRNLQYQLECLDKEIAELGQLLEIAQSRKSQARCLKCWSDRTSPLTFSSESNIAHDFQHECGGNLKIIHDHSGPRFNFRTSLYVLNEEGELLWSE